MPALGVAPHKQPWFKGATVVVVPSAGGPQLTHLKGSKHSRCIMNKALHGDRNVPSYIYDDEAVTLIKDALKRKASA